LAEIAELKKLRPPRPVLDIARALEAAGYEAWAVGGAVRDALLGETHLDWDLATSATPDQMRGVFGRGRIKPVGIDFGTVGVLDEKGIMHEVTTFRRDVRTDGRHAEVEFGASLEEDLARRDFTVNAIAYAPTREILADPFGGRDDLKRRVIRSVGDAAQRMREDRLRALRAIRFAARFQFAIDPATWQALRESAPYLTRLSAERVKQELEKTMEQVARPSEALRMWKDSGALAVLVPELVESDQSIGALDFAARPGVPRRPGRRLTRMAVLFSGIQPAAAQRAAERLKFSNNDAKWIGQVADRWAQLGEPMTAALMTRDQPDASTVRHWVAAIGRPMLHGFFRVAAARWGERRSVDSGSAPTAQAVHSLYRRSLRTALRDPVDLRDLAIDGDDLRRAGIAPGPRLGKILAALLELVLRDPTLNTRDVLLAEAQRLSADT
jgi:tRNA nucleotidyltransferase (CCA-adding enzyme)